MHSNITKRPTCYIFFAYHTIMNKFKIILELYRHILLQSLSDYYRDINTHMFFLKGHCSLCSPINEKLIINYLIERGYEY